MRDRVGSSAGGERNAFFYDWLLPFIFP